MRVAHVITRLSVGGAQENTLASVLGLRSKPGMELALFSGEAVGPEGSLEGVCAAYPGLLNLVPELVRPIRPWLDWKAWRRLTQFFRSLKPDIVHTHSGKAGILGRWAAATAGVPLIVHTIHGPSFGSFQNFAANVVFRAVERRTGTVTDHFVVVAEAMARQYLAAGIGRPERYTRIFSGFNVDRFVVASNETGLRAKLGLGPEDIVVGKIARLFKLKGHADLFAVARALVRECRHLKFLLVGDGEWRGRFEREAQRLGLGQHFIFTGLVTPEEVPALTGIMDMVVHLSAREGLPRALPQALAAARPVVAYDCDGANEVCFENQTGFLLRQGDLTGLQDRVLRLARDPALRERLGRQGQEFVKKHFRADSMVEQLHQLYLRLHNDGELGRRSRGGESSTKIAEGDKGR